MISRRGFFGALAGLPLIGNWFTPRAVDLRPGIKFVYPTSAPVSAMAYRGDGLYFLTVDGKAWKIDGTSRTPQQVSVHTATEQIAEAFRS